MDEIKDFLVRLTAAGLLCAILRSFPVSGTMKEILKILTGVFVLLTVFSPMSRINLPDFQSGLSVFRYDAEDIITQSQDERTESLREIIISQTQAYILDKAKTFGAELTVEVILDDSAIPIPCGVCIQGRCSPYAKQQLQQLITNELGIEAEGQVWIG